MNRRKIRIILLIIAVGYSFLLGLIAPSTVGQTIEEKKAQADRFLQDGLVEYHRGNYFQAINCFEHALFIYREIGDAWGEADSLGNLGLCYKSKGYYRRAISYHEQSLRICQETGYRLGEANCLANIGLCRHLLAEDQQAVDSFSQALAIFCELGNRQNEARTLLQLGISCRVLGEYERAKECDEQALHTFREIGDQSGEARSLNSLGNYAYRVGDFKEAMSLYERAHSLFRKIGDYSGMAASLGNLGGCHEALGEYEKAIGYYEAAIFVVQLTFYDALNARSMATSLNNLGVCYFRLANYVRAIRYHEEALVIFQEIDDKRGAAKAFANLGNCYHVLGEYSKAFELYKDSVSTFQEIGDRDSEATSLNALAGFYKEEGEFRTAITFYEQALIIEREIGDSRGETFSLLGLGLCYEALADYGQAIALFKESVALAQEIEAVEESWYGLWGLGRAHWRSGQLENAQAAFEQAIVTVEMLRSLIKVEPLRQTFFYKAQRLYEEYLEVLLETGKPEATLDVAERCRARTFLDSLAVGPIGTLENVVEKGIRSGVVNPAAISEDIQEVASSLPKNTAALEYFVTNEVTYVWVVSGASSQGPYRIPHGWKELMKTVVDCRRRLEKGDPAVNHHLAELYDWLIRPVEGVVQASTGDEISHLIIVPSGPLYYLPFQALLWTSEDRSEHAYLIERYALSYSPSLTIIKYTQALREQAYPEWTFLGLADPDSGDPSLRLPEAQEEARRIAAFFPVSRVCLGLDANEDVIEYRAGDMRLLLIAAHAVFNPDNPMYSYLLLSPTEENDGRLYAYEVFELSLKADTVVLSACETLLPALEKSEEQVQAVRESRKDASGGLTEGQLIGLTGGDEVVGFTRAFIIAGASSVLSSLWCVHSLATADLMVAFHLHLRDGMSKAQALREAQLEVMNSAGRAHPVFWAAFNLMGDWK